MLTIVTSTSNPLDLGAWAEALDRLGHRNVRRERVDSEPCLVVDVGGEDLRIVDGERIPPGEAPVAVTRVCLAGRGAVRVHARARLTGVRRELHWASFAPFVDERPEEWPLFWRSGERLQVAFCLGEQARVIGSGFFGWPDDSGEERVEFPLPTVRRSGVLDIILGILAECMTSLGEVPGGDDYVPALLTRVDVDTFDLEGLRLIVAAAEACDRRVTLCVNTGGEEETEDTLGPGVLTYPVRRHGALLRSLSANGHEVASHGHRHLLPANEPACVADIRTSLGELATVGAEIRGYAAPGGAWAPYLVAAVGQCGLAYSSELARGETGRPFPEPGAPVTQIPVSPVLQYALATPRAWDDVIALWRSAVADRRRLRESLSFVMHPPEAVELGGRRLRELFAVASQAELADRVFAEEAAAAQIGSVIK